MPVPLAARGSLLEKVNYVVNKNYRLGFLAAMLEVSAKLKEPELKERKFEEGWKRPTSRGGRRWC